MNMQSDDSATWRFTNSRGKPVHVHLEPWGDQVTVPPGSTLVVRVTECGREPLDVRETRGEIKVWATRPGCQLTAHLDGKKI